jgi:hypothetical protein
MMRDDVDGVLLVLGFFDDSFYSERICIACIDVSTYLCIIIGHSHVSKVWIRERFCKCSSTARWVNTRQIGLRFAFFATRIAIVSSID